MLELKISADRIDYEKLARFASPLLARHLADKGGAAAFLGKREGLLTALTVQLVKAMNDQDREELLVRLITEKSGEIEDRFNDFLEQEGIGVHVGDLTILQKDE